MHSKLPDLGFKPLPIMLYLYNWTAKKRILKKSTLKGAEEKSDEINLMKNCLQQNMMRDKWNADH